GVYKLSPRHMCGVVLGALAIVLAVAAFVSFDKLADQHRLTAPNNLTFVAPVQQPDSSLTVEVSNLEADASATSFAGLAWPILLALFVWAYAGLTERRWFK